MQAVVIHGVDDLRIDTLAEPTCGPNDVIVDVEFGGICGSDLHYWKHGAAGMSILKNPMILGHEVAGTITEVGANVNDLRVGQRAAIHPATVCHACNYCAIGAENLCNEVRYLGSAAYDPHTEGAFCGRKVIPAAQIRVLPENVSTRLGAAAEPLGVSLHAVKRAGDIRGKTILVNGAGPIGALAVIAAKHAGAGRVFAADVADQSLAHARAVGADDTINVLNASLPTDVDVVIEASGAAAALGGVFKAVRKGGTVVQVGNLAPGVLNVELSALISREITYVGSFRFLDDISEAIAFMAAGGNVEPLLTHTFGLSQVQTAFETALDRSTGSSKVLLDLRP